MGAVAWLFTSSIGRQLLAGVAIFALCLGVYFYIFHKGVTAGKAADTKATTETQKRIDDAATHGPHTPADVDKRLRDGRF